MWEGHNKKKNYFSIVRSESVCKVFLIFSGSERVLLGRKDPKSPKPPQVGKTDIESRER